ncbi:hypothetical protein SKAU_G00143740 [Synaphobranchus kaupii]|uniref:Uncharacterized protein n=1 Tax=Synaphobranchus kaupii TaxID=118154 RepID=A0A9Q1FTU4_SYNKA|nr:hypothetical protein SKAU_G00143740 [Synaphobranchus kaupii]
MLYEYVPGPQKTADTAARLALLVIVLSSPRVLTLATAFGNGGRFRDFPPSKHSEVNVTEPWDKTDDARAAPGPSEAFPPAFRGAACPRGYPRLSPDSTFSGPSLSAAHARYSPAAKGSFLLQRSTPCRAPRPIQEPGVQAVRRRIQRDVKKRIPTHK